MKEPLACVTSLCKDILLLVSWFTFGPHCRSVFGDLGWSSMAWDRFGWFRMSLNEFEWFSCMSETCTCVPDWNTWLDGVELLARCSLQDTQLWSGNSLVLFNWGKPSLILIASVSLMRFVVKRVLQGWMDVAALVSCNSRDRAVVLSTACPEAWRSWF